MEKRHAIIESATRLFGSIGFDAPTTLEIADEADVTEPLIYYHFKGKHELGIFLRNHFQASKVQFERNVKLTSQYFLRKWIDYSVLSRGVKACIVNNCWQLTIIKSIDNWIL